MFIEFIAKGELEGNKAGWFTSVARKAKALAPDANDIPTVVIETNDRNILIKEYDSMTIVLKSVKADD